MSKKLQRKENWKRKAEAFLHVAKLNDAERKAEQSVKRPRVSDTDSDDSTSPPPSEKKNKSVMAASQGDVTVDGNNAASAPESSMKNGQPKTEEELAKLRAQIRARQKASMERPKLITQFDQLSPLMTDCEYTHYRFDQQSGQQPPLFVMDVQHLLLYAIQGQMASFKPRWCKLLRWMKVSKVVVIVVEDLSITDVNRYAKALPYLTSAFPVSIELISPTQYDKTVAQELFNVSISFERFKKKQLAAGEQWKKRPMKPVTAVVVDQADNPVVHEDEGSAGRVSLLLNLQQMIQEGFPLPVASGYQADFVFTKESYKPVSASSPMYALDCEMCLTNARVLELTHVSIINEDLQIVYESLVKPYNPIINYLTKFSGITKEILQPVKTRLEDVQQTIQGILPDDAILCGQSLNGDMKALKMYHPYVIDTSVIFNLTGQRKMKTSLRVLTAKFLGREIQNDPSGHNPTEDAVATMELVQLKLKHGPNFGDVILGGLNYADPNGGQDEKEASDASDSEEGSSPKKAKLEQSTSTSNKEDQKSQTVKDPPTAATSAAQSCSITKRKVFFQGPGTIEYESFFPLANEAGRSVVLMDHADAAHVKSAQGLTPVEAVSTDSEAVARVQETHADHFMTCAYLNGFKTHHRQPTPSQTTEETLRKLNKHIKKIVKNLPERSLVTVICGGRTTGKEITNGISYVQIT